MIMRSELEKKKKKKEAITLPIDTARLNLKRGILLFSLFTLNLWFGFDVLNLGFILSNKSAMEILRVSQEASLECPGNVNSFRLMFWR